MDEHPETGEHEAFAGLLILMRLIWGPLYWPMLVANAIGFEWCISTAF